MEYFKIHKIAKQLSKVKFIFIYANQIVNVYQFECKPCTVINNCKFPVHQ